MVVLFFREYHYQLLACENIKKSSSTLFSVNSFSTEVYTKRINPIIINYCAEDRKNNYFLEEPLISLVLTIVDKLSIIFF